MKLLKKHPKRNGIVQNPYFYILPNNLAKEENKTEAKILCADNDMLYAIIDGTPRAVSKNQVDELQKCCTSYVRADGLRFSFGREQKDKTGGINYKHLLSDVLDGCPRAITFAKICKNQDYKNIKTLR